jgi:hypothetical protein
MEREICKQNFVPWGSGKFQRHYLAGSHQLAVMNHHTIPTGLVGSFLWPREVLRVRLVCSSWRYCRASWSSLNLSTLTASLCVNGAVQTLNIEQGCGSMAGQFPNVQTITLPAARLQELGAFDALVNIKVTDFAGEHDLVSLSRFENLHLTLQAQHHISPKSYEARIASLDLSHLCSLTLVTPSSAPLNCALLPGTLRHLDVALEWTDEKIALLEKRSPLLEHLMMRELGYTYSANAYFSRRALVPLASLSRLRTLGLFFKPSAGCSVDLGQLVACRSLACLHVDAGDELRGAYLPLELRLKVLELRLYQINADFLQRFPQLVKVSLASSSVACFPELHYLETLELRSCHYFAMEAAPGSRLCLPMLKTLNVDMADKEKIAFLTWLQVPKLVWLHVNLVTNAVIETITRFRTLETLWLTLKVTGIHLAPLASLPSLRRLDCGRGCIMVSELNEVCSLTRLEHLSCVMPRERQFPLSSLGRLIELRTLELSNCCFTKKELMAELTMCVWLQDLTVIGFQFEK